MHANTRQFALFDATKQCIHIFYLFTVDNIQPVVIPWTAVGMCSSLAAQTLTTEHFTPSLGQVASRAPQAFFWLWLNILIFAIANQRLPDSVREDKVNKPWRAIPCGKLSMGQARNALLALVPASVVVGMFLGVPQLTSFAIILSYLYNELGGADIHWFVRNLINALAMAVASAGTNAISLPSPDFDLSARGYLWIGLQVAIVMTTLQIQDLRDQEGDKLRGRSTMPIDVGEGATRQSSAVFIMLWSYICISFWSLDAISSSVVVACGLYLGARVCTYRDAASDRSSWKIWGAWTLLIFMMPLYKYLDPFTSSH